MNKKKSTKQKKHATPKKTRKPATPKTRPARKAARHYTRAEIAKRYDDRPPKARRPKTAAGRHAPKRPARKPSKPPKPEPCQHRSSRVLETRRPTSTDPTRDPGVYTIDTRIRRRLECLNCRTRFTEYTDTKSTGPTDRWKDRRYPGGDHPHH